MLHLPYAVTDTNLSSQIISMLVPEGKHVDFIMYMKLLVKLPAHRLLSSFTFRVWWLSVRFDYHSVLMVFSLSNLHYQLLHTSSISFIPNIFFSCTLMTYLLSLLIMATSTQMVLPFSLLS